MAKKRIKGKKKKIRRNIKRGFWLILIIMVLVGNSEIKKISYTNLAENTQNDKYIAKTTKPFKMAKNVVKKEIEVCSNSSAKSYMDYKMITDKSSNQYKYINESGKIEIKNGYLMENEYIGVALGSYFGEIGSKYVFTLDTGKELKVVKVEEKADEHTINGCQHKWDSSVIEFVIDSSYFKKSSNGYVFNGNFNNVEEFKGKIIKIEKVEK